MTFKPTYETFSDDVAADFHRPLLERSVLYKRSTGYFTSKSLIEVLEGVEGLIKNNGKIQILTSPDLSEEDITAIKEGYATRKEVIEKAMMREVDSVDFSDSDKDSLALLSRLIAYGILDIQVVYIESQGNFGIYHDKSAIAIDNKGNKIAFIGSLNATQAAHLHNYETIDVYSSLDGESDRKRIEYRESIFDETWRGEKEGLVIGNFPEKVRKKMESLSTVELPEVVYEHECYEEYTSEENPIVGPNIPESVELRPYQKEAIRNWEHENYRGIFDMATGTGKTFTGLAAAVHLYEKLGQHMALIIVVPYQHLVMQWVEDVEEFGFDPIIGFSTSPQKNWEKDLREKAMYYKFSKKRPNHLCFITTNATFSLPRIQEVLTRLEENVLLIVDEAHNVGSEKLQKKLLPQANYRLGLSATITRHGDEQGTEALLRYFGDVVFTYTLEQAIQSNMLTPYYYYPVVIHLTEEELAEYRKISHQIAKAIKKEKDGRVTFTESAKMLLIKRARLVAGAQNKIQALQEEIQKYKKDSHMLVYCGATTVNDPGYIEGNVDQSEVRQIDAVSNLLGNELEMKTTKFTSEEKTEERTAILKNFEGGSSLQVLNAIRCLDEGVNIPSIQRVFLLASSTNPKEYIQRRGRVLRKFPGKDYAYIHDFITLPVPLEEVRDYSFDEIRSMRSLVSREVNRLRDFASIAENSSEADQLIATLTDEFLLYELNEEGATKEEML